MIRTVKNKENRFNVFFFDHEELVINNGLLERYKFNELDSIRFVIKQTQYKGARPRFGRLYIHLKNKQKMQYLFDSSVYKKKYSFVSSIEDLEMAVEIMKNQLEEKGITVTIG